MILIALSLLFVSTVHAGGPVLGVCSESPVVKDFDATRVKIKYRMFIVRDKNLFTFIY